MSIVTFKFDIGDMIEDTRYGAQYTIVSRCQDENGLCYWLGDEWVEEKDIKLIEKGVG